jgi:hypothetical protein
MLVARLWGGACNKGRVKARPNRRPVINLWGKKVLLFYHLQNEAIFRPLVSSNRHTFFALFDDKCLLGIRKIACFHRSSLLLTARKVQRKTLIQNGPVFGKQITPFPNKVSVLRSPVESTTQSRYEAATVKSNAVK